MPRKSTNNDAVLIVRTQPDIKQKFSKVAENLDYKMAELFKLRLKQKCEQLGIPTDF